MNNEKLSDVFKTPPEDLAFLLKQAVDDYHIDRHPKEMAEHFFRTTKMTMFFFEKNLSKMKLDDCSFIIDIDKQFQNYSELFISSFGQKACDEALNGAAIAYYRLCQKYDE